MFVARIPVIENSLCVHDKTQTTPLYPDSPIVVPAGSVVTICGVDGETAKVKRIDACSQRPFGFCMMELRTQYNREYIPPMGVPTSDLGRNRAVVGAPVGVAHLGIWSTTVYDNDTTYTAGDLLFATASGTLTVSGGLGYCQSGYLNESPVAMAMNSLRAVDVASGRYLWFKALI